MTEKNIKSRITHKHDTEANWQLAVNFIPKQGEIIVYDVDKNYSYSRFKIGNGILNVNDLPFSGEGEKIYKQNEEPLNAENGTLWIDLDANPTPSGGGSSSNGNITLATDAWIDNEQTVNVDGVTENNTIIVGGDLGSEPMYTQCGVYCTGQSDGTLTFKCSKIPSADVVANVAIL